MGRADVEEVFGTRTRSARCNKDERHHHLRDLYAIHLQSTMGALCGFAAAGGLLRV